MRTNIFVSSLVLSVMAFATFTSMWQSPQMRYPTAGGALLGHSVSLQPEPAQRQLERYEDESRRPLFAIVRRSDVSSHLTFGCSTVAPSDSARLA
jgi:hypothetical protein